MKDFPLQVLEAYDLEPESVRPIESLINSTFRAHARGGRDVIVQRLHPVFAAEVNLDIEAVTKHLNAKSFPTPLLVRTRSGQLWVTTEDGSWRAQTLIPGKTVHRLSTTPEAEAAARFVARFHRALEDLTHEFVFQRANVHDTPAHIRALTDALRSEAAAEDAVSQELGRAVLAHVESVNVHFDYAPRICHGDPKISNLLFAPGDTPEVRCLIDLDTLGPQKIAYELGDALRSWCNTTGEDTVDATVNEGLFAAVMRGYARGSQGLLDQAERASLVDGLITVSAELASRFARDAIEDRYFGWDSMRFSSRREHNLLRARGQLALSQAARRKRAHLEASVLRAWKEAGHDDD